MSVISTWKIEGEKSKFQFLSENLQSIRKVVGMKYKKINYILFSFLFFILITILLSVTACGDFYRYNEKIYIKPTDQELGYIEPYKVTTILGNFAYLKWQRYGYPEGNIYPAPLIEDTSLPLPFGLENIYLQVKINRITKEGVDMDIDTSEIIPSSLITLTIPEVTITSLPIDTTPDINEVSNQIVTRLEKVTNRGYYSSLHITGSRALPIDSDVSRSIVKKELKLAEKLTDVVIPLLVKTVDIPTVVGGTFLAETYCKVTGMIPDSVRSPVTQYLTNIDTKNDIRYPSEYELSKDGAFTIYVGGPAVNVVAKQMNDHLTARNLPHFEKRYGTWIIIGDREYTDGSVGIVAAIPEEKMWTTSTMNKRWDEDKIRFYRTLIAGIEKEGTVAGGKWYTDQLDLTITNLNTVRVSICMGDLENLDTGDILSVLGDMAHKNPKAMTSVSVLLQGWVLASMNILQTGKFDKVESLGYVVIVQQEGNGYKVLEIHSIIGDKKERL